MVLVKEETNSEVPDPFFHDLLGLREVHSMDVHPRRLEIFFFFIIIIIYLFGEKKI